MKRTKFSHDDGVFIMLSAAKIKPPQMGNFTSPLTGEAVEFKNRRRNKLLSDKGGARI